MATKKTQTVTPEEIKGALTTLETLGFKNTYIYDDLQDALPVEFRGPQTYEGWIPVDVTGTRDALTDSDLRKINELLKKNWPELTYTRGTLTWSITPSWTWQEA